MCVYQFDVYDQNGNPASKELHETIKKKEIIRIRKCQSIKQISCLRDEILLLFHFTVNENNAHSAYLVYILAKIAKILPHITFLTLRRHQGLLFIVTYIYIYMYIYLIYFGMVP